MLMEAGGQKPKIKPKWKHKRRLTCMRTELLAWFRETSSQHQTKTRTGLRTSGSTIKRCLHDLKRGFHPNANHWLLSGGWPDQICLKSLPGKKKLKSSDRWNQNEWSVEEKRNGSWSKACTLPPCLTGNMTQGWVAVSGTEPLVFTDDVTTDRSSRMDYTDSDMSRLIDPMTQIILPK